MSLMCCRGPGGVSWGVVADRLRSWGRAFAASGSPRWWAEGFLSVVFQAGRTRVLPVLVPDGALQAANAYLGTGLSAALAGAAGLLVLAGRAAEADAARATR